MVQSEPEDIRGTTGMFTFNPDKNNGSSFVPTERPAHRSSIDTQTEVPKMPQPDVKEAAVHRSPVKVHNFEIPKELMHPGKASPDFGTRIQASEKKTKAYNSPFVSHSNAKVSQRANSQDPS